jgi:hypothetical protein
MPTVTETTPRPEPVTPDPFIADTMRLAVDEVEGRSSISIISPRRVDRSPPSMARRVTSAGRSSMTGRSPT